MSAKSASCTSCGKQIMPKMKRCNFCGSSQSSVARTSNLKQLQELTEQNPVGNDAVGSKSKEVHSEPLTSTISPQSHKPGGDARNTSRHPKTSKLRIAQVIAFGSVLALGILIITEEFKYQSDIRFVDGLKHTGKVSISLYKDYGVLSLNGQVNSSVDVSFVLDSGAADVALPDDIIQSLLATGSLSESDSLGVGQYILANGDVVQSQRYNLRSIRVGEVIVENVQASTSPQGSPALLGQSFLSKFKSWNVDNGRNILWLDLPQ